MWTLIKYGETNFSIRGFVHKYVNNLKHELQEERRNGFVYFAYTCF